MSRRQLARRLEQLAGFETPRLALEQYPTPGELAATVLHEADLRGDLGGLVVDLGTGTGVLAIGAALRSAASVVGVDRDGDALAVAAENEAATSPDTPISWLRGDVERLPLAVEDATVVMNPPFGAQRGNRHADRPFLAAAAGIASVSYSIHNRDSRSFVDGFAADRGGTLTHAFAAALDLDRQFAHHRTDRKTIDVEVYRIEWA